MLNPLQLFKSLSDATRLQILLLLTTNEELCVCEITHALGEIQPKISRHLAHLKQHSLIDDRRQGQWIFYRLSQDLPDWASKVLTETHAQSTALISDAESALQQMQARPVRCA